MIDYLPLIRKAIAGAVVPQVVIFLAWLTGWDWSSASPLIEMMLVGLVQGIATGVIVWWVRNRKPGSPAP